MHFDDRLATVLRQPVSGDALARIQYRQLVDILGRAPAHANSDVVEAGFARIAALSNRIPARDRARLLRQPLQPMTNARLFSLLAEAEPEVATAAIASARLPEADWLALIPRLPVRARGILRHRRDLSPRVEEMLERLGIRDRALPPAPPVHVATVEQPPQTSPTAPKAPTTEAEIEELVLSEMLGPLPDDTQAAPGSPPPVADEALPAPTSLAEWARMKAASHISASDRDEAGIGAIVRRIEEFRKARETQGTVQDSNTDSPRLPLGDTAAGVPRGPTVIDFATDAQGRINWADGPHAGSVIGFRLEEHQSMAGAAGSIATALRHRLPLNGVCIALSGAPSISGEWQVDALARFDPAGGRFAGYCGRMRRPAKLTTPGSEPANAGEADRMREVLHELRTPANAIQVAAEIIQQQVFGPAPHEYRALAASIASDCAHILAGFEELDRLVKLETGALLLEAGECDLGDVIGTTLARLRSWTEPRRTGFALAGALPPATPDKALAVSMDRAEAERLIWRLLAALAGSTAPDEWLALSWKQDEAAIGLHIALPTSLAARHGEDLFESSESGRSHTLTTGMFGVGFTLRLAAAEAAAAGGHLQRLDNQLVLTLPRLTLCAAGNSVVATGSH